MTTEELDKRFRFKLLDERQQDRVRYLRDKFAEMALWLDQECHDGRYKSICMTHLEDACTAAVKSIVWE